MPTPNFRLRGFQRLSDAVVNSLGELEGKVLSEVRRQGETNVGRVCDALDGTYAYTTVMTTLDRLYKKDLLIRSKSGRAFFYSAKYSVEEMERGLAEDVMNSLFDANPARTTPVLACIVDSVSDRDLQMLDELERLVQEKRRELEEKE